MKQVTGLFCYSVNVWRDIIKKFLKLVDKSFIYYNILLIEIEKKNVYQWKI